MSGSIVYFGRNPAMMALVENQLKAAGIAATGYLDEEALMAVLAKGEVRLLVMGGGVEDGPRWRLKAYCQEHGILVLEHYQGPGSLPDSIGQVLGRPVG